MWWWWHIEVRWNYSEGKQEGQSDGSYHIMYKKHTDKRSGRRAKLHGQKWENVSNTTSFSHGFLPKHSKFLSVLKYTTTYVAFIV